jgi:ferric-dicitrate binding protein FerR (iron transport regulator)
MDIDRMPYKLFAKKLSGTADQNDEQEFRKLVQHDDRVLIEFRMIQRIWEEAGHIKAFESIPVGEDWKSVSAKLNDKFQLNHKRVHWSSYFLRIAAILIISGGLSAAFYQYLVAPEKDSSGFTTISNPDQKKDFILPDGSTITLNKGSQITYRNGFGTISRDVILEGDAFFDVIPGAEMPFRVFSNESVIEVTGTRFSVYEKNGQIHVAVVSGTVLLSSLKSSAKQVNISANQSGCVLNDNELKVENGIPVNDLSWKTGLLSFEQTRIDSALLDIAFHFNRELTIVDPVNEKITAEFLDQPLKEILEEINLVAGLAFDTTGNALIVRK